MRVAPLLGVLALVLVTTTATADGPVTRAEVTRTELLRVVNDLGDAIGEADASFARQSGNGQKVAALYAKLDEKATALRKAGAVCANGCNAEQAKALVTAAKEMEQTQASFSTQYVQLQSQMQAEDKTYKTVSNIMKTKHDTVKNTISNIR